MVQEVFYVIEVDSEACIAFWQTHSPHEPCRQRFYLHDAERGVIAAYDDVPVWAYHGSNSFMNAHRFHVGQDGVIRMWPIVKDDAELESKKTDERCSVDFHRDGKTTAECRSGQLASVGSFALWRLPDGDALYETLDAGGTWRLIDTPAPVARTTEIWCEATGCAIGDRIRLGWGEPR